MGCGNSCEDAALDRNAELLSLVDQVVGDAAAGEADESLGQEFQQLVVSPERSGPSVCVPVWPADDLVDALRLGPTRRDLFCTRSAAMHEHHVRILAVDVIECGADGLGVLDGLGAGDGNERAFGQVRLGLLVLSGAEEVAGIDCRGGELRGSAGVRAVSRAPGFAGVAAVMLGGGIAELLEGVAPIAEVAGALDDSLQFPGVDLGPVLGALEVLQLRREPVDRPVQPLGLHVQGVDEAPEQRFALVGELGISGGHEQRSADADLASRRIVREPLIVAHIGVLTNTQDRLLCSDLTRTVRLDSPMNTWVGIDRMPDWRMGLLTFRAIAILFDDPAKVFRMGSAETEGYFASGRYLRDLRCDLFLDFDRLIEQLCRVMIGTFGYTPEIVAFLKENFGRLNVSPDRRRAGVMSELDTGGWFAETIEDEAIYRNYLQPLAGLHLDRAANQAPGSLPGDRLGPMRRVGAAYGSPLEADRRGATGRRAGPCGSRPRAR